MDSNMFPATADAPPVDDGRMINLIDKIDKSECYAKNEDASFPFTNLFMGDSRLGCKSDADEQLILFIEFNEFVKVKSIQLTEFNNGMDPECNPSKIHLFVNRENLGFEDAASVDPTQTLHLTTQDFSKPIPLKFVKFQRVKSITLFVEDNQGGEVSCLGGLQFFGRSIASTNMADFKKQKE